MYNEMLPDAFIAAVEALCGKVRLASIYLIPLGLTLTMGVQYFKGWLFERSNQIDYSPVVKGFVLVFILGFYVEFTALVGGAVGGFCALVGRPANIYMSIGTLVGTAPKGVSPIEEFVAGVQTVWNLDFFQMIVGWLSGGIVFCIRKLVEFLAGSLLSFLYCVGPIAIALSLIPAFSGLAIKWFQNYLSIQLWAVTLIVLDHLVSLYATYSWQASTSQDMGFFAEAHDDLNFTIMSFMIIILYCMVPYLTNFFIGYTAASGFQSKAIGTAAKAAMVAASAGGALAGGAVKGAGAMASGASQAASTGGKVISGVRSGVSGAYQSVRSAYDSYQGARQTSRQQTPSMILQPAKRPKGAKEPIQEY